MADERMNDVPAQSDTMSTLQKELTTAGKVADNKFKKAFIGEHLSGLSEGKLRFYIKESAGSLERKNDMLTRDHKPEPLLVIDVMPTSNLSYDEVIQLVQDGLGTVPVIKEKYSGLQSAQEQADAAVNVQDKTAGLNGNNFAIAYPTNDKGSYIFQVRLKDMKLEDLYQSIAGSISDKITQEQASQQSQDMTVPAAPDAPMPQQSMTDQATGQKTDMQTASDIPIPDQQAQPVPVTPDKQSMTHVEKIMQRRAEQEANPAVAATVK